MGLSFSRPLHVQGVLATTAATFTHQNVTRYGMLLVTVFARSCALRRVRRIPPPLHLLEAKRASHPRQRHERASQRRYLTRWQLKYNVHGLVEREDERCRERRE